MCRATTFVRDISFVVTKQKKLEGFDAGVSIQVRNECYFTSVIRHQNFRC